MSDEWNEKLDEPLTAEVDEELDAKDEAADEEFEENFFRCFECGSAAELDEARMRRDGEAVCERCAANYFSCACCEYFFRREETLPHAGRCPACRDCPPGTIHL